MESERLQIGQIVECPGHGSQKIGAIDDSIPEDPVCILECGCLYPHETETIARAKADNVRIEAIDFYCEIRQSVNAKGEFRRPYLFCERKETDEDFIVESDFENIPAGSLFISFRHGPIETDEENDKNIRLIIMEDRKIVDAFKIFLNNDNEKRCECSTKIYGRGCPEEGDHYVLFTFIFERTSDGGLLLKRTAKWPEALADAGFGSNNIEIKLHRSIVQAVKEVVNKNF